MLKKLMKFAAVAAVAAVTFTGAAKADLQDIISSGKIRVGVPIDTPPFGSIDRDNNPVGFDIDVARLIAEDLGVDLELVQITGANRIPYLVTDRLDLVIASMGGTPTRAQQIAFSSPYAAITIGVFGPDSTGVLSPADLGDLVIGVPRGTTQDLALSAVAPEANIQRFDDDATSAAAFLSGQVDLMAASNVTTKAIVDANDDVELNTRFIFRLAPTHIGLQQGNPELTRWLDTFVFFHHIKGTFSDLSVKWLGQPLPANFPSL